MAYEITRSKRNENGLFQYQHFSIGPRPAPERLGYKDGSAIWALVRFDDSCGNGHHTFSITGSVFEPGEKHASAVGCLHDEIAECFPELAPLIKWHLCSTSGPMHYLANTIFLAGDRDCFGRSPGEASAWENIVKFGNSPVSHVIKSNSFFSFLKGMILPPVIVPVAHGTRNIGDYPFEDKYTFKGFDCKWYECPFDSRREAEEWAEALCSVPARFDTIPTAFSQGKKRELDAARQAAIWPDATDEELMADDLKERLVQRLPGLLSEFRRDMESLGFEW